MYKIIIIYFIFSSALFAQNLESLVLNDTIVLMIDKNYVLDDSKVKIVKNNINESFILIFSDEKQLLFLTHNSGLFASENFKICKKKYKIQNTNYKIFSFDNLLKIGFDKVTNTMISKKIVLYIVDVKSNNRKRVLLKRAHMQYLPKIEM